MEKPTIKPAAKTMTQHATRSHKISQIDHGIIKWQVLPDAHIGSAELKESEKATVAIYKTQKKLLLIDASNFHTLTPDATEFMKKNNHKSRIATAIVLSNISQKITAKFISGKCPVKTFVSENEAVKWLLSLKRKV
jgi:hypothetical protein